MLLLKVKPSTLITSANTLVYTSPATKNYSDISKGNLTMTKL